ncbi:hypothetical protein HDU79_007922 [Rhizoclosmatium sp. JEL0117]|nr:hypothetical protein HDU79_007922 [Rhizoclosmatium sp. JEL0117]
MGNTASQQTPPTPPFSQSRSRASSVGSNAVSARAEAEAALSPNQVRATNPVRLGPRTSATTVSSVSSVASVASRVVRVSASLGRRLSTSTSTSTSAPTTSTPTQLADDSNANGIITRPVRRDSQFSLESRASTVRRLVRPSWLRSSFTSVDQTVQQPSLHEPATPSSLHTDFIDTLPVSAELDPVSPAVKIDNLVSNEELLSVDSQPLNQSTFVGSSSLAIVTEEDERTAALKEDVTPRPNDVSNEIALLPLDSVDVELSPSAETPKAVLEPINSVDDASDYNIPIHLDIALEEYEINEVQPTSLEDELRIATTNDPAINNTVALDESEGSVIVDPFVETVEPLVQNDATAVTIDGVREQLETETHEEESSFSTSSSIEADLRRLSALVQALTQMEELEAQEAAAAAATMTANVDADANANVDADANFVADVVNASESLGINAEAQVSEPNAPNLSRQTENVLAVEAEATEPTNETSSGADEGQAGQEQQRPPPQNISMMILILGPPGSASPPSQQNDNQDAAPATEPQSIDHEQQVESEQGTEDHPGDGDTQRTPQQGSGFRMVIILTAPDGSGRIAEIPLSGPGLPPGFPPMGAVGVPGESGDGGEGGPDYDALVRLAEMIGPARPRHAHIDDVKEQLPLVEFKRLPSEEEAVEVGFVGISEIDPGMERIQGLLGETKEKCTVCLMPYEDGDMLRILKCNHGFHSDCIDQWLTSHVNSCPICRQTGVEVRVAPTEQAPPRQAQANQGPPPPFLQAIIREMLMRGPPQQPPPNSEVQSPQTESPTPPANQHDDVATGASSSEPLVDHEPAAQEPHTNTSDTDPQADHQDNDGPPPEFLRNALLPLLASLLMGLDRLQQLQQQSETDHQTQADETTESSETSRGTDGIEEHEVPDAPPRQPPHPPRTLGEFLSMLSEASNIERMQRNPETGEFASSEVQNASTGPGNTWEEDGIRVSAVQDGEAGTSADENDYWDEEDDEEMEATLQRLNEILGIRHPHFPPHPDERDQEEEEEEEFEALFIPALADWADDNVSIDD